MRARYAICLGLTALLVNAFTTTAHADITINAPAGTGAACPAGDGSNTPNPRRPVHLPPPPSPVLGGLFHELVNGDQTFTGWTFAIGSSLNGTLTVDTYSSLFFENHFSGLEFVARYNRADTDPVNLRWIQMVTTSSPLGGMISPYIDPARDDKPGPPGGPNPPETPFYWTETEIPGYTNGVDAFGAFNLGFADKSRRRHNPNSSVTWTGELYLVSWSGATDANNEAVPGLVTIHDGVRWGWNAGCAVAAPAGESEDKSFNFDNSNLMDVPDSITYGGAADQSGHWNCFTAGSTGPFPLLDLNGNPTTVTVDVTGSASGHSGGDFSFDNPSITRGDEALMDDCYAVLSGETEMTWTFSGLDDGVYRVFMYAMAPDPFSQMDVERGAGDSECAGSLVGGFWPGDHEQDISYGLFYETVSSGVTGGVLQYRIQSGSPFDSSTFINGVQISHGAGGTGIDGSAPGELLCSGDGSGSPCPCGNESAEPGGGCDNSTGQGAILTGSGSNSVSSNDLVLQAWDVLPGQPGLLFQGENSINSDNGTPFGDGLRCAGLNVRRLEIMVPDAFGEAISSVSIIDSSNSINAGDQRFYQFWYRDPSPSAPCGTTFNLTNSYGITWTP